ncbi:cytochrome c biogenesis CcdA family protein [Tabrizicola sp. M-4]|uniref:cytochrome c biogenesis CcdA family protein n=1 Tax=Tabrizicola sp. M-4 TaxID=3055847 RepID=UPI003DA8BB6B
MIDLLFAYGAGLLTLINPCILPILPIVLSTALSADRRAPLRLAFGMSLSFVTLGLILSAAGPALGLSPETAARAAALLMAGFGLVMLVPAFSARFATATTAFAARADRGLGSDWATSPSGQIAGGLLLGAVWSPCIGPTLGAAISLAAQRTDLLGAGLTMVAFAAGVSTLILALAYGAKSRLQARKALLLRLAPKARPILGATFLAVGLFLWSGLNHPVEAWLLDTLPPWLTDLSVAL